MSQSADNIFIDALNLPADQREGFLREACGSDHHLLHQVTELLASTDAAGEFFDQLTSTITSRQSDELEDYAARGHHVGSYQIEHLLAQGGMGAVFMARRADGHFDRQVVIKMMPQSFSADALAERFAEETRVLASLSHPNIAQLLDAGVDEELGAYFVMEYLQGLSITEHCRRHGLDRGHKLALVGQLLDALQYAHRNLVIHNDIKPSNVLVTGDGVVKLLDFGIASGIYSQSRAGEYSPAYAAPEQHTGERSTTATDTYQCGRLLAELFAEAEPGNAGPPEFNTLEPELRAIVERATRTDPAERYNSAAELAMELNRLLEGLPVDAVPSTTAYLARKFLHRHRLGVASAALILALTFGFAAVMALQAQRISEQRDRAQAASLVANAERDRAVGMTDFLVSVFETANPGISPGADPSASEILDRGLERIREDPALLGASRVDLLLVIARTFEGLGDYDQAAQILDEAMVEVSEASPSPVNLALRARVLGQIGENLRLRGQVDEAETVLSQAIEILASQYPERTELRAECLGKLGRVRGLQGNYAAARQDLAAAATLVRELRGEQHTDYAQALNDLASVDFSEGDYPSVRRLLSQALQIREQLAASQPSLRLDPAYATNINNLGLAYFRLGDLPLARDYFEQAVALRRQIYRQPHPEQAQSLTNLGLLLDAMGRSGEALAPLQEALEIRLSALGERHMRVAESYNNLGMLHLSEAQFAEALARYQSAYPIVAEALGQDHPATATVISNMGQSQLELGQAQQALAQFEKSLRIREEKLPPDHLFISYSLVGLGRALDATGKSADALEPLRRALNIRRQKLPADHWLVSEAELALAMALADSAPQEARDLAESAQRNLLVSKGKDHYLAARATILATNLGVEAADSPTP